MLVYSASGSGFDNHDGRMPFMAHETSVSVHPILKKNPRGKVHSVFQNSFNMVFGDRLVHVGSSVNGLAPFGIGVYQKDTRHINRQVRNSQQVRWSASTKTLIFAGGLSISLKHAVLTDHFLRDTTFDRAILISNLEFVVEQLLVNNWRTGIVQTYEDQRVFLHYLLPAPASSDGHPIVNELANLESLARGNKTVVPKNSFDYWIGRGLGLTPSGDDLITGMCAMLSVLQDQNENEWFRKRLKSYLMEKGLKRTTPIGFEYLLYAADRQYHTHLIDMCHALLDSSKAGLLSALEDMKKIGHTSGADTLAGVLLGIKGSFFEGGTAGE